MASRSPRSSRYFIAALLAGVLAGGLVGAGSIHWLSPRHGGSTGPNCSAPTTLPTSSRTPIHHVFFLIKENHALENYFGTLPGVDGYPPNGTFPTSYSGPGTISPYALPGNWTGDLPHDRGSYEAAVDGGRMDHFVAQAAALGYPNADQAVGYYTSAQVPDYFSYARNYTLDDHFFGGVLGPTLPNRLFDLGLTGTNWTSDLPPPGSAVAGPTFPNQLAAAGLPWAYYYSGPELYLAPQLVPQIANDSCLAAQIQPVSGLASVLQGPDPPAFAYIDPSNDMNASEHPPANVTFGDQWTVAVVNEIFSSPIGASSAIFIFYDEGGGFWDPVAPPAFPPLGDGARVPLLVLSPYTPQGWIDHQMLDPANLLHWVEWNWNLTPLDARVGNATLPSGLFNFSLPPRAPLLLPTPIHLGSTSGAGPSSGTRSVASVDTISGDAGPVAARTSVGHVMQPTGRPPVRREIVHRPIAC